MSYLPGSFFVVDTPGPGGFLIGIAQSLVNDASRYKHCGIILDVQGNVLEAEPRGARVANLREYAGDGLIICDGPVRRQVAAGDPRGAARHILDSRGEDEIRADVVSAARRLVGTPYSWLDYAAIAALKLHLPSKALRRYVASSGHAQCAQLVDLAYQRAGIELFTDGRQPGDVCPADLAAWAEDWQRSQETP